MTSGGREGLRLPGSMAFMLRPCAATSPRIGSGGQPLLRVQAARLPPMKQLVLLRHGQSQWNLENRFTGWVDVGLTDQGVAEARRAGRLLREGGYDFDVVHTSLLKRAIKTMFLALEEMDRLEAPRQALVAAQRAPLRRAHRPRQGGDRREARRRPGEDLAPQLRHAAPRDGRGRSREPVERSSLRPPRSVRAPPDRVPEGHRRPVPPLLGGDSIRPDLEAGKRVLIVAHGNYPPRPREVSRRHERGRDRRPEHPHRRAARLRAERRPPRRRSTSTSATPTRSRRAPRPSRSRPRRAERTEPAPRRIRRSFEIAPESTAEAGQSERAARPSSSIPRSRRPVSGAPGVLAPARAPRPPTSMLRFASTLRTIPPEHLRRRDRSSNMGLRRHAQHPGALRPGLPRGRPAPAPRGAEGRASRALRGSAQPRPRRGPRVPGLPALRRGGRPPGHRLDGGDRRLGRVFLRLFEEHEDLPLYLLPDVSGSAWVEDPPRAVAGLRACLALAAVSLGQHDTVGVFPFSSDLEVLQRPTSGKGRLMQLAARMSTLAEPAAERSATDLRQAMKRFRALGLRDFTLW